MASAPGQDHSQEHGLSLLFFFFFFLKSNLKHQNLYITSLSSYDLVKGNSVFFVTSKSKMYII